MIKINSKGIVIDEDGMEKFRVDSNGIFITEDNQIGMIDSVDQIPPGSVVTKLTGEKPYKLIDRIRIFGDFDGQRRDIDPGPGFRFLTADNGDHQTISYDTKLIWYDSIEEIERHLNASYRNDSAQVELIFRADQLPRNTVVRRLSDKSTLHVLEDRALLPSATIEVGPTKRILTPRWLQAKNKPDVYFVIDGDTRLIWMTTRGEALQFIENLIDPYGNR